MLLEQAGKKDLGRKRSFRKGQPAQLLRQKRKGIAQKEMPVITGASTCVHQKGNFKIGDKCASKHAEKAGANQRNERNSVVVAKTLDHTQAEEKITWLICTECELFWRNQVHKTIVRNSIKKFRLARVADRFVREHEKKGQTLRILATFRVARLILQTRKLWLVGVANDRDAPLACPNVNNQSSIKIKQTKMKRNASKNKNDEKRKTKQK